MFRQLLPILVLMGIVGIPSASARSSDSSEFLDQVHDLTLQCVVQPFQFNNNGEKILGDLRSICPELNAAESEALFEIKGQTFRALLSESASSDDGDLNNLIILDSSLRVVARRMNVLAFNNIFLAMTGGDDQFPQVLDASPSAH